MAAVSEAAPQSVDSARRIALLREVPALATLPEAILEYLAAGLAEEHYAAGGVVVAEGDAGDRLFVVVTGHAEVAAASPSGPVPLAALGPGELFGELALLEPGAVRQATVTALTDLHLLSLDGYAFQTLLASQPAARAAFDAAAERLHTARFLKLASPFAALAPAQTLALAGHLTRQEVAAGTTVVRQGEVGDTAYLVLSGRLEVVLEADDGTEHRLATLRPGMMFGETALLTRAPRNATVRAAEPCELLMLHRDDLLTVMGEEHAVSMRMFELLQLRARPQQVAGIIVHERTTPEGETIRILKDPRRGRYYRLSPQGWFLWQRLDGQRTMRHLALDYFDEYKSFAPQAIAQVLGGLTAAGFIVTPDLPADVLQRALHVTWWQRALLAASKIATWQAAVPGIDGRLTQLYQGGVRILYTRPAQVALLLLIVTGLVAFFTGSVRVREALAAAGPALFLFLIPANLFAIFIHEAGHAFTVKAFGREVQRAGVGWYWFGPVAFVDTSDMWLADRWPRIAVSLAGGYANLVLAAFAALAALVVQDLVWAAALWQFAFWSYWVVLANLNPLLEYDGYYVLADWLDRPNLRARALAWLGNDLLPALRTPGGLRGHTVDLLYGVGAVLYVGLAGVLTVVIYRATVEGWLTRILPAQVAAGLVWVLAVLVVLSAGGALVSELRAARPAHGRS